MEKVWKEMRYANNLKLFLLYAFVLQENTCSFLKVSVLDVKFLQETCPNKLSSSEWAPFLCSPSTSCIAHTLLFLTLWTYLSQTLYSKLHESLYPLHKNMVSSDI